MQVLDVINVIEIQDQYIKTVSATAETSRHYGKVMAHAWRIAVDALVYIGLGQGVAEQMMYEAHDTVKLNRLAMSK